MSKHKHDNLDSKQPHQSSTDQHKHSGSCNDSCGHSKHTGSGTQKESEFFGSTKNANSGSHTNPKEHHNNPQSSGNHGQKEGTHSYLPSRDTQHSGGEKWDSKTPGSHNHDSKTSGSHEKDHTFGNKKTNPSQNKEDESTHDKSNPGFQKKKF